jgi:hypothetical protein
MKQTWTRSGRVAKRSSGSRNGFAKKLLGLVQAIPVSMRASSINRQGAVYDGTESEGRGWSSERAVTKHENKE